MPETCLESRDTRRRRYPRARKRFTDHENACFAPKMTRPQPPRMVNTTCSSFQFAGLPGSSQGYATLGGALGSAARNGRRRVREGQRQGSSRRVELDAERAFTSGRASVRPLGRHPRATGRVEKYPTGAQSEGFGARGWERTGHATGGLGHGALGHRVEAAGQGGGGAKNSGHLRVVARTEVLSAGRAIEFWRHGPQSVDRIRHTTRATSESTSGHDAW